MFCNCRSLAGWSYEKRCTRGRGSYCIKASLVKILQDNRMEWKISTLIGTFPFRLICSLWGLSFKMWPLKCFVNLSQTFEMFFRIAVFFACFMIYLNVLVSICNKHNSATYWNVILQISATLEKAKGFITSSPEKWTALERWASTRSSTATGWDTATSRRAARVIERDLDILVVFQITDGGFTRPLSELYFCWLLYYCCDVVLIHCLATENQWD